MPDDGAAGARRPHRFLRWTLVAGAVYDFVFAFLMLAAPAALERTFALPRPEPGFYLRLIAVLLAMLGATYLFAAGDPAARRGLVAIAIVGRLGGALVLGQAAATGDGLAGLWPAAVGDALFAALHAGGSRGLFR